MKTERATRQKPPSPEEDPALQRIQEDRQPGELETAMHSGSDDEGDLYIGDRFPAEMTPEEARRALCAPTPTEREEAKGSRARAPTAGNKSRK